MSSNYYFGFFCNFFSIDLGSMHQSFELMSANIHLAPNILIILAGDIQLISESITSSPFDTKRHQSQHYCTCAT